MSLRAFLDRRLLVFRFLPVDGLFLPVPVLPARRPLLRFVDRAHGRGMHAWGHHLSRSGLSWSSALRLGAFPLGRMLLGFFSRLQFHFLLAFLLVLDGGLRGVWVARSLGGGGLRSRSHVGPGDRSYGYCHPHCP